MYYDALLAAGYSNLQLFVILFGMIVLILYLCFRNTNNNNKNEKIKW